jgi:hypothetical protein
MLEFGATWSRCDDLCVKLAISVPATILVMSVPAYEEAIPTTRTIVGDWSPDELGNRTRIIKGA